MTRLHRFATTALLTLQRATSGPPEELSLEIVPSWNDDSPALVLKSGSHDIGYAAAYDPEIPFPPARSPSPSPTNPTETPSLRPGFRIYRPFYRPASRVEPEIYDSEDTGRIASGEPQAAALLILTFLEDLVHQTLSDMAEAEPFPSENTPP